MNCGICGKWAHFGCDRRQGLGAFKVCLPYLSYIKFGWMPVVFYMKEYMLSKISC